MINLLNNQNFNLIKIILQIKMILMKNYQVQDQKKKSQQKHLKYIKMTQLIIQNNNKNKILNNNYPIKKN